MMADIEAELLMPVDAAYALARIELALATGMVVVIVLETKPELKDANPGGVAKLALEEGAKEVTENDGEATPGGKLIWRLLLAGVMVTEGVGTRVMELVWVVGVAGVEAPLVTGREEVGVTTAEDEAEAIAVEKEGGTMRVVLAVEFMAALLVVGVAGVA
jgi:hypothetical protein